MAVNEKKLFINMDIVNKYRNQKVDQHSPSSTESPCSKRTSPYRFSYSPRSDSNIISPKDKFIKISPKKHDSKIINIKEDSIETKIIRSRSISESQITIKKQLNSTISYETLPSVKINPNEYNKNLNNDSSIRTVITYIINNKLKLKEINSDEYIKKFEDNLILNLEILCSQHPDVIDKLNLPMALETEIKNLIVEKNKLNKSILSYNEITSDLKDEICQLLVTIMKNNYYRNLLFDKFYEDWLKKDSRAQELISFKSMDFKSKKLFGTIRLLINFLQNNNEIMEEIDNMVTIHLILNINDYSVFSQTLIDTISKIAVERMDDKMKDALFLAIKELCNIILKHHEIVRRGKKYYIYYRKNKKWNKCFCNITHEVIMISNYPHNEPINEIKIEDICNLERIEEADNRILKQTNYCIKIMLNTFGDVYICTDTPEYINNIYKDIHLRLEAIELKMK